MEAPVRPLRADAARNRARVLDAARTAFAEAGLDVGVEEIARRAGVGKGTLYRRFPTKEALVRAIFEDILDEMERNVAASAAIEDAGEAFAHYLSSAARMQASNQGFFDVVAHGLGAGALTDEQRQRIVAAADRAAAARAGGGSDPRRPRARGHVADPADDRRRPRARPRTGARWTIAGRATSACCSTRCDRKRRRRSRPSPGA